MDRDKKEALEQIYRAAVAGADPVSSVRDNISIGAGELIIGGVLYPLSDISDIFLVSAGKASVGMASAALDSLGSLLTAGVVSTPYSTGRPLSSRIRVVESSHPVPDQMSVEAARAAMSIATGATADDLVLCLLSGGASSLMALPATGITLVDKQETTDLLLGSGADIAEVNIVRKHLSDIKGGRLAAAAHPAWVSCLAISDVPGDDPSTIASGPVSPDVSSFGQAVDILKMRGVYQRLPGRVREHLEAGIAGLVAETPGKDNPAFERASVTVIASNRTALAGAADVAGYLGYEPRVSETPLTGEASEAGRMIAVEALAGLSSSGGKQLCLIYGGETTVTIKGHGAGGRNQEVAASFARAVDGVQGISALFAGTDGIDGPTDAAGGFVDGGTCAAAAGVGVDLGSALSDNDCYAALDAAGCLFSPGPTGTNVMDIGIILIN